MEKENSLGSLTSDALSLLIGIKLLNKEVFDEYRQRKYAELQKVKGGNNMETKSRYEVISDLEKQKRDLIINKKGLGDKLKDMERRLKEMNRNIEDQKEEIEYFKKQMKEQEQTYDELIKSCDESLKRFTNLESKK